MNKNDASVEAACQHLQKIIEADSKDSSFTFRDQSEAVTFKIYYPCFFQETSDKEVILRSFWKHFNSRYFKALTEEELAQIHYWLKMARKNIANCSRSKKAPGKTNLKRRNWQNERVRPLPAFSSFSDMSNLHERNENRQQNQKKKSRRPSGMSSLHLPNKFGLRKTKVITKPLQSLRRKLLLRSNLTPTYSSPSKENQCNSNKNVPSLSPSHLTRQKPIDQQIERLEEEVQKISQQNIKHLLKVQNQIEKEIKNNSKNGPSIKQDFLNCIQFAIDYLEQKQFAESISVVIAPQNIKRDASFLVGFEQALNISPQPIPAAELKELNCLRETSLFKFGRTGAKSLYNYIAPNYAGFAEMIRDRMKLNHLKNQDLFPTMQRGLSSSKLHSVQEKMREFASCHHCKCLFPRDVLTKCPFSSKFQNAPQSCQEINSEIDLDHLPSEHGHLQSEHRLRGGSKKLLLMSYAKKNDLFSCDRMFCKGCITDNYSQQSIATGGDCPFCENICTCTRCTRNGIVNKFKHIYTSLGRDCTRIMFKRCLDVAPQNLLEKKQKKPIRNLAPKTKLIKKTKQSFPSKITESLKTKRVLRQRKQAIKIQRMSRIRCSTNYLQSETEKGSTWSEDEAQWLPRRSILI